MANTGNNPYEVEETTLDFRNGLELLLQQRVSILRPLVEVGSYVGKGARMLNQIGVLNAPAAGARYSDGVPQIPFFTSRWVFPNDREIRVWVDTFDELRSIVDPKGGITQASAAAIGRYFDDLIINAATGSATTGPDPSNYSTESFDTAASTSGGAVVADTFGASASTGLTWPKIVEAERGMRRRRALDNEKPCLIIGSQQNANLKLQQEVISREYGIGMIGSDGNVGSVGIFDVYVSDRLNTSSSDTLRNCIAFVRSGLHLGVWRDMNTFIDNLPTKVSRPWQLLSMVTAGATRTQQYKTFQINAADTSGQDPTA